MLPCGPWYRQGFPRTVGTRRALECALIMPFAYGRLHPLHALRTCLTLAPASVECDGTGAGAQVACGCSSLASHRGTAEPSRHRAAIVQLVAHDGDRAGDERRDYADGSADAVSRGRRPSASSLARARQHLGRRAGRRAESARPPALAQGFFFRRFLRKEKVVCFFLHLDS